MQELISSLQKAISFDSSTKAGAVKCLHWVLDLAGKLGFATGNMDDMVGWAEYGEGEELVCVLGHLDVVPAGNGWTKDPFGGEIENNRLYGRGTTDDKGPMMAALYALKSIKDSGISLKRRIRLLFGTEEETGCEDMKYYVEHGGELPTLGFTPDGEFPLIHGEKGLLIESYRCDFNPGQIKAIWGGTAANMVPDHAYALLEDGTKIECTGKSSHGAEPWNGENAIGKLLAKLNALPLSGQLKTAVEFLHSRIGMETDGASLGIAMADEPSGRLSFNLGMLRADETSITVTVNYRYPVTKHYEDCVPQVRAAFAHAGFELVSASHDEKLYLPADHPLVEKLIGVYNDYTGENARPICIGGGTYAKSMPNIVAFGPIFPGDEVTEHEPDEYIALDRLVQNHDIIRLAMLALAKRYKLCKPKETTMDIHGLQKLTLLDYPGKVACTVFLGGCDFRCPYCHNWELVDGSYPSTMTEQELFSFLKKRQGLLDGVCVTGGEPLLRPELPEFLRKIRDLGYLVKLDTNGSHPQRLRQLLDEGLVDYVAMDIKNSPEHYGETIGQPDFDITPIKESAQLLKEGSVDYEFRTTVVNELHDEEDFLSIAEWLRGAKRCFLQPFTDRDTVPMAGLSAPDDEALSRYAGILRETVPDTTIRGI